MSKVPEARARLEKLLAGLDAGHKPTHGWIADEVRGTLELMTREKPIRVAPRVSDPIDRDKVKQIKTMFYEHADWTFQKIGSALNVSSGRVSEVLNGKRDDNGGELIE